MRQFKKGLVIILSFIIFFTANAKFIPPSDTLIEYSGRIDFSNPESPTFSCSGVSIRTAFKGTGIAAILNDKRGRNYYNIILDKSQIIVFKVETGEKQYVLAENLKDTIHEIEIFKRTEEMFGKTSFLGFLLNENDSLVENTMTRESLIEFIGNSITCGYGNEGLNGDKFNSPTENHYMTYAAITSRSFNSRHLAVCKSGIGIYRNWNGPLKGNEDCMPYLYDRIFLSDENPKYQFTDTPDLVCINLGTNDFSTTGGDSALYVSGYLNFIDDLQIYYNKPEIVCLLGSMFEGETLDNIRRYIQFIADSANNKGMGNVYFFEMSEQTGDLGIGIDYHPSVSQHIRNASELINYISTLNDWTIQPLVVKAEVYDRNKVIINFNTEISDPTETYSGFSIAVNNELVDIENIYKNELDKTKLFLELKEHINPGQEVILNYNNGKLIGTGNEELQAFNNFYVDN